jgi:hypothetical protein
MRILVIVPIARPANADSVAKGFSNQTYKGAELAFAPSPGLRLDTPHIVLPPTDNIGDARNVGLGFARVCGYDWAVFWDDDNYHGPDYLAEVVRHIEPGIDVLSKGIAFVRKDSGLWLYHSPLKFFPGHSTSVRVDAAESYPPWSLSEDVEWSKRMLAKGAKARHLPPWGLVYDRRGPEGHAYKADETEFLRGHGPAEHLGNTPNEYVNSPKVVKAPTLSASDEAVFLSLERRARIRQR